eukprot:scaffold6552_cov71-Cyclotella_meneghiniana.AAC.3
MNRKSLPVGLLDGFCYASSWMRVIPETEQYTFCLVRNDYWDLHLLIRFLAPVSNTSQEVRMNGGGRSKKSFNNYNYTPPMIA